MAVAALYEFLCKVPLFSGLSQQDLERLADVVGEVHLAQGDELFAEGSPGEIAYVIKEGEVEILKASAEREVLLAVREPGEVIGEMALLEEAPRMASARARRDSVVLSIEKEQLDTLLETSVSAANAMFRNILGRWRATESMLRQSEKMAQLGTLSAGVAHELNNPAGAVVRSADQLREAIDGLGEAHTAADRLDLDDPQLAELAALAERARSGADSPAKLDAMARSDREYDLETWLEDQGVDEAWELAPTLVDLGFDDAELSRIAGLFPGDQLLPVVSLLNATYKAHSLMSEVRSGASRISDIVKALKSYSYLDQAPVQSVNVHDGLDDTLMILRNKLSGIAVNREFGTDLPEIMAYGSELNQVWTNLIDNAADALGESGTITLRTHMDGDTILVEVEDDGPGVPEDVQPRVFDSFFTTKAPGQGTGLGLDISYNIVVQKHRGDITLESRPGQTVFRVRLPVNFDAS
jgi:signal transduction histidine kinase